MPFVALKLMGVSGGAGAGTTLSELCVMSAATFDVPPGAIELGVAEAASTNQGLKSTPVPVTAPQPALPGPALQPHQLFSMSEVLFCGLSIAVVVATMRLKCAVKCGKKASGGLFGSSSSWRAVVAPVMVLPVSVAVESDCVLLAGSLTEAATTATFDVPLMMLFLMVKLPSLTLMPK